MPSFGNRDASRSKAAEGAKQLQCLFAWVWIAAVVVLYFLIALSAYVRWEATLPFPQDTAPGFRADIGPYVAVKDCPTRRWTAGEYLPASCRAENTFYRNEAPHYGLSFIFTTRGLVHRHTLYWVRQGNDALEVMCPHFAPCLIQTVVKDRFIGPLAPIPASPQETEYTRPPMAFQFGYWFDICVTATPVGVILLIFLITRARRQGSLESS